MNGAIVNFLPDVDHHGVLAAMSMLLPNILVCLLYVPASNTVPPQRSVINMRSAASDRTHVSGQSTGVTLGFAAPRKRASSLDYELSAAAAGSSSHSRGSTALKARAHEVASS